MFVPSLPCMSMNCLCLHYRCFFFFFFICLLFWATPIDTHGLLLTMLRKPYGAPGIKPRLIMHKASTLPSVSTVASAPSLQMSCDDWFTCLSFLVSLRFLSICPTSQRLVYYIHSKLLVKVVKKKQISVK